MKQKYILFDDLDVFPEGEVAAKVFVYSVDSAGLGLRVTERRVPAPINALPYIVVLTRTLPRACVGCVADAQQLLFYGVRRKVPITLDVYQIFFWCFGDYLIVPDCFHGAS
jgi:hypothetical protein